MANDKDKAMASAPNKPVMVYRLKGLSASVFENKTKANGEDRIFMKVSLQRVYRDGDDWKTTTALGRDDLPVARLLLDRAWQFILDAEAYQKDDKE